MGDRTKHLVRIALASGIRRFHAAPSDAWRNRLDQLADAMHEEGVEREAVYIVMELLPQGDSHLVGRVSSHLLAFLLSLLQLPFLVTLLTHSNCRPFPINCICMMHNIVFKLLDFLSLLEKLFTEGSYG
jgi:hypothetical protein